MKTAGVYVLIAICQQNRNKILYRKQHKREKIETRTDIVLEARRRVPIQRKHIRDNYYYFTRLLWMPKNKNSFSHFVDCQINNNETNKEDIHPRNIIETI